MLIAFAILSAVLAIFFVLKSDRALLTHPKGVIARSELKLITTNILLMLVVIVPTYFFLFWVAWKYRSKNAKSKQKSSPSQGPFRELILWIIPSIVVLVMAIITWKATHALDPYRKLESENKTLKIQVIALDWKWLFIYPEQGIATLNFVQFPEKTPIHFELAADNSPMNSFWIPQLSGQIYAMSGMVTPLHIMADGAGTYVGRASEINGEGFADMTFVVKSTSLSEFEEWVNTAKGSAFPLTHSTYETLLQKAVNNSVILYSDVEKDLFHHVVMKYMHCCP